MQWTEATDLSLVEKAMRAVGLTGVRRAGTTGVVATDTGGNSVLFHGGRLTFVSDTFDEDALKQRYAADVVRDRFTALGWEVEEQDKPSTVAAGFTRSWD